MSGHVFDPAGRLPLYNVVVYVPNAPLEGLKSGATCDKCGTVSGSPLVATLTDAAGAFKLDNVPVMKGMPLVMQVGKRRRHVTLPIDIQPCTDNPLTEAAIADLTRLPKNQAEGDIPLMALSTGGADALECLLRSVGIDDSEFTTASGAGRVHLYLGSPRPGDDMGSPASASFDMAHGGAAFDPSETLWSDVNKLQAYDVLLLGCEGEVFADRKPQAALDALYEYTALGGRVFASHWHRFWFDPVASSNGPTLGTTQFPNLGTWNDDISWNPGTNVMTTVDTSFPKGQAMHDWLANVGALEADKLPILYAKKNLESVDPTNAQQWVTYDSPKSVQYMSFNTPKTVPDDQRCGRVVYSDLHVASGTGDNAGQPWPSGCHSTELSPQQQTLEFMLFDLASCIKKDSEPPEPPK